MDASDTAIRVVLEQQQSDGFWHSLRFFLYKLNPTEAHYCTYDRELLAIYQTIKLFEKIL